MREWIFLGLLLTVVTPLASGYETAVIDGLTWKYAVSDAGSIVIHGLDSPRGDITIPKEINGKSVTSVGDYAFNSCSGLTSIIIPDGLVSIGNYAFNGCSGLTSMAIPLSVVSIGSLAFYGCSGLTSVTIPGSMARLQSIFPDTYTKISKVVICEGSSCIAASLFLGCKGLTSVTIPDGVTSIGENAFSGCSGLTSVTIPEGVTSIAKYTFFSCGGLMSVTIPSSVMSIGEYAFSGCSGLASMTIPEGVTSIGEHAFSTCSGLTSVTIPSSVTSVGSEAFSGCSGLVEVHISDLLAWCGIVFAGPGGNGIHTDGEVSRANPLAAGAKLYLKGKEITHLDIPWGVSEIGPYSFCGYGSLISVTIPLSVRNIGYSAFCGCKGLTSVEIFGGMIGSYTFSGCTKLREVTMHEGVTGIGSSAFSGCSGLTAVTIPLSVTSIGRSAFSWCRGLTAVTIPSGVTSVGPDAFDGCSGLTSVTIEEGVTSIDSCAFYGCSGLTSVTIPSSVTTIEDGAFGWCNMLADVYFSSKALLPTMGEDVFVGCHWDLIGHVPADWKGRNPMVGGIYLERAAGEASAVCLTITNVVVNYVLNSVQPEIATPATSDTGFVNIIAEVKGGVVSVPESWSRNYSGFVDKFGTDFSKALAMKTGKKDGAGNEMLVWQDYVAGTDPTDENDVFRASITIVDGKVTISYTPELDDARKEMRKYTTWGKTSLMDTDWTEVQDGHEAEYNFFKVSVEMR